MSSTKAELWERIYNITGVFPPVINDNLLDYTPEEDIDQIEPPHNEEFINSYNTRYNTFFPTVGKRKPFTLMGIELELEERNELNVYLAYHFLFTKHKYAFLKSDGSLQNGFEICSKPASLIRHKEILGEFLVANRLLGPYKLKKQPSCGLHVHLDTYKMSELQKNKIYSFINLISNKKFIFYIAGRDNNRYALVHNNDKFISEQIFNTTENFTTTLQSKSRYDAVNITNNTIELRMAAASTNNKSLFSRIEFADAIMKFTAPGNVNIKESMDITSFSNFVNKNKKIYPNLLKVISKYFEVQKASDIIVDEVEE